MPEVNACFEQLLHRDVCQATSSVGLHPSRRPWPGSLRIAFPVSPPLMRVREDFVPVDASVNSPPEPKGEPLPVVSRQLPVSAGY
jgi:hypothetical protein